MTRFLKTNRSMLSSSLCLFTLLILLSVGLSTGAEEKQGILMKPADGDLFHYEDDFSTPRCFREALPQGWDISAWTPGSLVNQGPQSNTLTYRFYAQRSIDSFKINIAQRANGASLGGLNQVLLSTNGLDWQVAASSNTQSANASGWQADPFALTSADHPDLLGGEEIWLRLLLRNYSGLKTNSSNYIDQISFEATLGLTLAQAAGQAQEKWSAALKDNDHRVLIFDAAAPIEVRPPFYLKDVDGWMTEASAPIFSDQEKTIRFGRAYRDEDRTPLGMGLFLKTRASEQGAFVRMVLHAHPKAPRTLNFIWDGAVLASLDSASAWNEKQEWIVPIPGPISEGVHALALESVDPDTSATLQRVEVVGAAIESWAPKPASPSPGLLTTPFSAYLPDPAPPLDSQAVEGRNKNGALSIAGMQQFYQDHQDFGSLWITLRNVGEAPLRIQRLYLNGRPIEEYYVDFVESAWDAPGVVWYRIRPRSLEPGACGQAYVRFRRRPDGDLARLTFELEIGAPITVEIPYVDPGLRMDYVTTGPDQKRLYYYVRQTQENQGELAYISLDGQPMDKAAIYGADFPGGVALAVVDLKKPLALGSYHVAGAITDTGAHIESQFRVLPHFFPRSSIHAPATIAKDMNMNLLTWRMQSRETCLESGLPTSAMHSDVMHLHDQVPFIFAPDEPDAKDNRGGGYPRGLGWHARCLAESGWQELVAAHTPPAYSWMNMNGTVRPLNWAVYGQVGDVNGFDPYPVTYYQADHAFVRESLGYVRHCAAPTRLYAILEAYGWRGGDGVPEDSRGPSPQEYRQNVLQSIGSGMKGLSSWVHSKSAGGWDQQEAFTQEIATANALISQVENELILASPIALAQVKTDQTPTGIVGNEVWEKDRVWCGCLLSGPDTIVLAVVNHIQATKPELPTITPAENVLVEINLPDYLPRVRVSEVTASGSKPKDCEQEGSLLRLQIPELHVGGLYLLERSE